MIDSTEEKTRQYKVFLEGETVDLCIPSEEAILLDGWADWFNNIPSLQNTVHGIFPNHIKDQLAVLELSSQKNKIVLLVCRKKDHHAIGVISLQNIDLALRQAEIAIMIGRPEKITLPSISALEAMALISEHGMKEVGLHKIHAGQAYPGLEGWNKLLEVIGYRVDGISRSAFRRGHLYSDVLLISLLHDDYKRLIDHRGIYWPSIKHIMEVLRKQPKTSFAEKLDNSISTISNEHFKYLFE
jgi:RimJ/RimL family protein N-acetyltransferase